MVSVSGAARVQSWEIATQRTPHVFSSPSLSPSFPSDSFPSHFLSSLPPRSGPQSAKSLGSAVTFPAGFDAEPGPRKSFLSAQKMCLVAKVLVLFLGSNTTLCSIAPTPLSKFSPRMHRDECHNPCPRFPHGYATGGC